MKLRPLGISRQTSHYVHSDVFDDIMTHNVHEYLLGSTEKSIFEFCHIILRFNHSLSKLSKMSSLKGRTLMTNIQILCVRTVL